MSDTKKNEITKKDQNDVAIMGTHQLFSNEGFEGTTNDSFLIPMMKIVQALSPVRKKQDPAYLPNADEGMFWNPALSEVYETLEVRVLAVDHQLVVWKPRSEGGGLVGIYKKTEEDKVVAKREGVKKWDENGYDIMDTIVFTCMDANNPANIFFFPMSSASLKYAKGWASKMRAVKINPKTMNLDPVGGQSGAASWAVVWKLGTVMDSNDQGSWYTIGSTPEAVRTFTQEETDAISAALDMLAKAKHSYEDMAEESSSESEDTSF